MNKRIYIVQLLPVEDISVVDSEISKYGVLYNVAVTMNYRNTT